MKNQNHSYLFLVWPKYLAQWYAHEMYRLSVLDEKVQPPFMYNCDVEVSDLEPVKTLRGSAERNILELCLTKQPESIPAKNPSDATICIEIPYFANRPPEVYSYLRPSGRDLLETTVRNHFRLALTKWMNKMLFQYRVIKAGGSATQEKVIEAFMEANGIEYTETNLLAIKQLWRRLANNEYNARLRRKNYENTGS